MRPLNFPSKKKKKSSINSFSTSYYVCVNTFLSWIPHVVSYNNKGHHLTVEWVAAVCCVNDLSRRDREKHTKNLIGGLNRPETVSRGSYRENEARHTTRETTSFLIK